MKVSTKNTKEVMRKDALRFRGCIHSDSWVNLIPYSSNFFSQNKNKKTRGSQFHFYIIVIGYLLQKPFLISQITKAKAQRR